MKLINMLVRLLVVVGAINWGLVGFFQFDLVASIFGGSTTMLARVIYAAVGIAGVLSLKSIYKCACSCHKGGNSCCK
jgi:hypothetical protein